MFSLCSGGIVNSTLDVCKTLEITCPCSRDTGHARRSRSRRRKIRPDRLSHRTISGLSDRTRPIDLSRARRRTHDTSRTTRHARHDHGTCTVQRRSVLVSQLGTFGYTPNLRYVCRNTNIGKNCHRSDSLDKLMRPTKNSKEIIANC